MSKLTPAQEAKMKEHKKHHTAQHMKSMRTAMVAGKSFSAAHKLAQAKDKKAKKAKVG
tara:strand:+ start:420 stop:593 length:174 start_codon:yes stop_codon:yes gene_type:complete